MALTCHGSHEPVSRPLRHIENTAHNHQIGCHATNQRTNTPAHFPKGHIWDTARNVHWCGDFYVGQRRCLGGPKSARRRRRWFDGYWVHTQPLFLQQMVSPAIRENNTLGTDQTLAWSTYKQRLESTEQDGYGIKAFAYCASLSFWSLHTPLTTLEEGGGI